MKILPKKIHNSKGFSVIIAILLTAFLVTLSSWILGIVLQESRNSRLVYNTISTYEWAEWAIELALLKVKNHEEWFADMVNINDEDYDLYKNTPNFNPKKDPSLEYEIKNYTFIYSWSIEPWEIDIIPMYYDDWIKVDSTNPETNSKLIWTWTSHIITTKNFKLDPGWDLVRNIIWTFNWNTAWISWTWVDNLAIWTDIATMKSEWYFKFLTGSLSIADTQEIRYDSSYSIKTFMYSTILQYPYLIIFNPSPSTPVKYTLTSIEWFSLPKLSIIWTSRIGNFKQNIEFGEDKSKYLEMLKYSIINK